MDTQIQQVQMIAYWIDVYALAQGQGVGYGWPLIPVPHTYV